MIAVDGKALRGSHELGKGMDHAVRAWAADTGVSLAQEFVIEKSNQIAAIPKLLAQLDLQGHIVTLDAMGTHVHIALQIVDGGAGYILALNRNQGISLKEVIDHFDISLRHLDLKKAKGWSVSRETEKGHGRHTIRTVLSTTNLTSLAPEICERWPELKSLIAVEVDTTVVGSGKKRKRERRYDLGSKEGDAKFFQKAIRQHWSIEINATGFWIPAFVKTTIRPVNSTRPRTSERCVESCSTSLKRTRA